MDEKQDHFDLLRKIKEKPSSTQRELASELGFSLGKLNYCPKSLKKIKNVSQKKKEMKF
jgi:predicted transcriptional regulator